MNCMTDMNDNSKQGQVVAMAYVPMEPYGTVYTPTEAWDTGTLFPDLNKPFEGKGGNCHG